MMENLLVEYMHGILSLVMSGMDIEATKGMRRREREE